MSETTNRQISEVEFAHMAGRRTADELTAHLLTTMSEQIKALTSEMGEIKATLHSIQLAMVTHQGHIDAKIEVLDQKVRSLEGWRSDATKQIVTIVVLVLVALFFAIAQGAGLKLR